MFKRVGRKSITSIIVLVVGGYFTALYAESSPVRGIEITPISVNVAINEPNATVTIKNTTDSTSYVVQNQVVALVKGSNNQYAPTQDVLVTPVIVKLAPGASQQLRVGIVSPRPVLEEQRYRLYIKQIPVIAQPQLTTGLILILNMGIPVWLLPDKPVYTVATVSQRINNQLQVKIINTGNAHVKLLSVAATRQRTAIDQEVVASKDHIDLNLLPGQSTQITLPLKQPISAALKMNVVTDPSSQVAS